MRRSPPPPAVTCVIMQNTGAGLHAALSEFVDGANDGACVVRWPPAEKDKDKSAAATPSVTCVATVFGIAV